MKLIFFSEKPLVNFISLKRPQIGMVFKKVLVILRESRDSGPVFLYLKRIKISGKVILAALDVRGIPISGLIASLRGAEWLEEVSKSFTEFSVETRVVKYSGDKLPAEAFAELAEKEGCDLIIVPSKRSEKPVTVNFASTLTLVSSVPVVVMPIEGA